MGIITTGIVYFQHVIIDHFGAALDDESKNRRINKDCSLKVHSDSVKLPVYIFEGDRFTMKKKCVISLLLALAMVLSTVILGQPALAEDQQPLFTIGTITDGLYRSDYLGIEFPFAELGLVNRTFTLSNLGAYMPNNLDATTEKAIETLTQEGRMVLDLKCTYNEIKDTLGREFVNCEVLFYDPSSDYGRDREMRHTQYKYDSSFTGKMDSSTMTIGDREWESFDVKYVEGEKTSFYRSLYSSDKDFVAEIDIEYSNEAGPTYDQAKPWFDAVCAACRSIDPDAPAPTPKPTSVPLAITEGVLLEKEGMRVSVNGGVYLYHLAINSQTVELSFQVENTTDKSKFFGIYASYILVNGQETFFDSEIKEIPAHETVDFSFVIFIDDGLEPEDIHEIQIPFDLYNSGATHWHETDLGDVVLTIGE